jgi:hypothetical protein
MPLDQWYVLEDQVVRRLYEVVMSLGGKLSGEHGIGIKRKAYFQDVVDPHELELMRTLKQALDPNNILNPGKFLTWIEALLLVNLCQRYTKAITGRSISQERPTPPAPSLCFAGGGRTGV